MCAKGLALQINSCTCKHEAKQTDTIRATKGKTRISSINKWAPRHWRRLPPSMRCNACCAPCTACWAPCIASCISPTGPCCRRRGCRWPLPACTSVGAALLGLPSATLLMAAAGVAAAGAATAAGSSCCCCCCCTRRWCRRGLADAAVAAAVAAASAARAASLPGALLPSCGREGAQRGTAGLAPTGQALQAVQPGDLAGAAQHSSPPRRRAPSAPACPPPPPPRALPPRCRPSGGPSALQGAAGALQGGWDHASCCQ